MSRLSVGVAADSDAISTLESALRVAFGPTGKGVMLKEGSTGILTVTRSSREIARATFDGLVPPPWLLPVLSAAEGLQKDAGDGGKGLLLGALAVSRLDLSPQTARDALKLADHLAYLSVPNAKLPQSKVAVIVRTFLGTRLTPVVLNAVLPSVCDWLNQGREFALKHAQSLCRVEQTLGPVCGTACSEGVVILGRTANVPQVQQKLKLVVILDGSVPNTELAGTLVASRSLEEKVVARLVASGAAVVHGLTEADAQLLGEADCTEVEVKHVRRGVWVSVPGVRQLVVHAPVATLSREIVRTVRDALALVCYSDDRIVRAGALERCLLRRLIQPRSRASSGKPPPVGRELLLSLSSTKDDKGADDMAALVLDVVPTFPEMSTILGVAVSASMPPRLSNDSDGFEPVTLRLAVLAGALSAGSRCKIATTPLPARRLHS